MEVIREGRLWVYLFIRSSAFGLKLWCLAICAVSGGSRAENNELGIDS